MSAVSEKAKAHRKKQKREYYQRNRKAIIAKNKEWSDANPERCKEIAKAWRSRNPKKVAYNSHKQNSKRRYTMFNITFADWCKWWGDDFEKRGPGAGNLCMCRIGDAGVYELGNIYKGSRSLNGTHGNEKRWGT